MNKDQFSQWKTVLAAYLKPGQVTAVWGEVARTFRDGDGGRYFVLFVNGTWQEFAAERSIEIKPRTIKASDVKPGMAVRPEGTNCPIRVELVVPNDRARVHKIALLGCRTSSADQLWYCLGEQYECEVVE